jgi:pyridoxal phosphate enzyme (YggS family)
MDQGRIRQNLESVKVRIAEAARRSGRMPDSVTLVAVTKKCPVEAVRPLVAAGALDLGENYPQELSRKVEALSNLDAPVRWHLIGHLQGNKAKRTVPLVTMIHAVDSLKLLRALDGLASELANPPSVCLQVNTSGEEAKHGWSPEAILADAESIAACSRIPVVGLMTMAAWGTDAETARPSFVSLREARDELRRRTGLALPELSMGMSGDFESAIEEGATLVRVGSALFEGAET